MRAEVTVRALTVSLLAKLLRQVENNRSRQAVILASKCQKGLARLWLDIGRVHHRQLPGSQPLRSNEVQDCKSIRSCCLAVFIVTDQSSAKVGR